MSRTVKPSRKIRQCNNLDRKGPESLPDLNIPRIQKSATQTGSLVCEMDQQHVYTAKYEHERLEGP